MICHHYACVFVHVPKTAGISIEHVFLDLLGLTWETRAPLLLRANDRPELGPPRLAHLKAADYVRYHYLTQEMFDRYFKFAFVRNPWSRLVSLYKYRAYNWRCDFKTFVKGPLQSRLWHEQDWFVCPQSEFLYSADNRLLVDFVGRYETLQRDFDAVCGHLGLAATPLSHFNTSRGNTQVALPGSGLKRTLGNLKRAWRTRNIPSYTTYQEYYDSETIAEVARLYQRDIELLGYSFE